MVLSPNLRFTSDLDPDTPDTPAEAALRKIYDRSSDLVEKGRKAEAAELALKALRGEAMSPAMAARFVSVLRLAGNPAAPQAEAALVDAVRDHLARMPDTDPDSARRQLNFGRILLVLDRYDEARAVLAAALPQDPLFMPAVRALTALLMKTEDPEGIIAIWQPAFDADPADGEVRLLLARLLAYGGFRDQARRILDLAEPLCQENRFAFEFVADGIRGTRAARSQAAMTVEIFNSFAASYDKVLDQIGNKGPEVIARLLKQVKPRRDRKLDVLDAGCGTGLCAPFLKPLSRVLHGVDISPGMLDQAKKRNKYDWLTRSDLNTLSTIPPGPFDLVVCADVLVYFGDLGPVLANFARLMRPGAWLVFTVEDAGAAAPARGWDLTASGRHKHAAAYLARVLMANGFTAPRTTIEAELRYEFGMPVYGLGVAAQRLALFG